MEGTDSVLQVADDLKERDSSGPGSQDHVSPPIGGAVVSSPFLIFQGCEQIGSCPQERYEDHGVGRANREGGGRHGLRLLVEGRPMNGRTGARPWASAVSHRATKGLDSEIVTV